jgi:hypothetical protein
MISVGEWHGVAFAWLAIKKRVRRLASGWRLRMIPYINRLASESNARVALLDILMATADQLAFGEKHGPEIFGDRQDVALATAQKINAEANRLADQTFPLERLAELRAAINRQVGESSHSNYFEKDRLHEAAIARIIGADSAEVASGSGMFGALQQSIGSTATELVRMNRQVQHLSGVADYAPTYARWSMEMLIEDVMSRPDIVELQSNISGIETALGGIEEKLGVLSSSLVELPESQVSLIKQIRKETVKHIMTELEAILWKAFGLALVLVLVGITFWRLTEIWVAKSKPKAN